MARPTLPRRLREKDQTWEDAKAFVLAEVERRGEMESPEMVKALKERFGFKDDLAYNAIKVNLDRGRIHYAVISGRKGARMLYPGMGKGTTKFVSDPKAQAAVKGPEEKTPTIEEEVVEQEVIEEVAELIAKPEYNEETVVGASEEDAIQAEMRKVAKGTIRQLLNNVDRELEKALTPTLRAQLRLVTTIAKEAGMVVEGKDARPLRQRDALWSALEELEATDR